MKFPRAFAIALFAIAPCLAQNSQITGRIADPTGAVVANVSVTVTNSDTGARQTTASNGQGYFTTSKLDPGNYELSIKHSGFRPVARKGIVLAVDQTIRLDIALEVGDVNQSIEITAAPPLIESETSNVGQVVNNKSIVEMPLNGRNAWDLAMLAGGTAYIDAIGDAGEIPIVSVAGSRTVSQGFMLDGGSVQKAGLARGQAELAPMVDAVEEFKVITNNYAAEYGRTAGGVFTAVTKSGTNRFHGSVFEFFRNDKMDARNFFALTKAPLRYNQFGATLGGPIRKNKTHFFAAFEETKTTRGSTLLLTVPTPRQIGGDFSSLFDATGFRLPIYDPATQRANPSNPTQLIRDAYPGNVIPASQFDPVAVKALTYYPAPNQPGAIAGANNFNVNIVAPRIQRHGTLRLDHVLTEKDRIFGRFVAQQNDAPQANAFAEGAASGQGPATRNIYNFARTYLVSWVRTLSPSVLNDFKFATIDQTREIFHDSTDKNWPEKLGLRGVGRNSFPIFRPAGFTFLGSPNTFRDQTNPGKQLTETLSVYRGSHSLKAGLEYRHTRTTDEFDRMPSGDFTFAQAGTGLPGNARSGNGLATMLLGTVTSASINDSPLFGFNTYYVGVYLQDDWKVTPRLTLNLGVRWDLEPGRAADGNTQNGFSFDKIHPIAKVPGVVTFAGVDEPERLFNTDKNNFAPRFGFAWRPFASEKTVIRGGFGLFYSNPDDQGYSNNAVLGFATQGLLVSANQEQGSAFLLRTGVNDVKAPGPADRTPAFGINGPIDFYERNRSTPYSLQYNFGVQHQLKSFLISGQYMANLGRRLTGAVMSINQVPPELVGKAGTVQSRRPFPHFSDVSVDSPNIGYSSYHGFLLRVEKQYHNGFQFLFNYAFSKFIDNTDALIDFGGIPGNGYQDLYNRRLDKSLSSNDLRHNSSFNVIYELPAGPRRRWLSRGPLSQILGGWQLSALGVLRSGAPVGVSAQQNTCQCSSVGPLRPNLLRNPNLPVGQRAVERWFDTSAFSQPDPFLFGTAARSVAEGPGLVNLNLALMKNFVLHERIRLQFRGEAFNAFNKPNFGMPGQTFGAPTFGIINNARDGRVIQLGLKIYF